MSKEICLLEEGHNLFSLEYRLSAGNLSRKNHENVVYQKLKHLDDVIFRVLVFGVRVFLYKVWFFFFQIYMTHVNIERDSLKTVLVFICTYFHNNSSEIWSIGYYYMCTTDALFCNYHMLHELTNVEGCYRYHISY